jgi:GNAT superfamily N-acetyltransferase
VRSSVNKDDTPLAWKRVMTKLVIVIRNPTAADEEAWCRLWSQYNAFYQATISEAITALTWQRILDPTSAMFVRLAVIDGTIGGFSVSVLHESTWTSEPVCYLEDLFVSPEYRSRGCGQMLIEDLIGRANSEGWSRLYWHTASNNPARKLYDRFVAADGFVRYRINFDKVRDESSTP